MYFLPAGLAEAQVGRHYDAVDLLFHINTKVQSGGGRVEEGGSFAFQLRRPNSGKSSFDYGAPRAENLL